MKKRKPEIVVISDVHLGTLGCHAKELLEYLKGIKPSKLILNGDIIDIWQFRKSYFPKAHLDVIRYIIAMQAKGTEVVYITGNHDEMLRKFSGTVIGGFKIVDKLLLELDGKKAWFFHGDVFDVSIQNAKWIAKLGGWGYNILILLNRLLNWFLVKTGRKKYSLSRRIKNSVKEAMKYISNFEASVAELAIENGYKYAICGHIHQPKMVRKITKNGICLYLNSGDWIEHLTALEYKNRKWKLVNFQELQEKKQQEEQPNLTALTIFSKK